MKKIKKYLLNFFIITVSLLIFAFLFDFFLFGLSDRNNKRNMFVEDRIYENFLQDSTIFKINLNLQRLKRLKAGIEIDDSMLARKFWEKILREDEKSRLKRIVGAQKYGQNFFDNSDNVENNNFIPPPDLNQNILKTIKEAEERKKLVKKVALPDKTRVSLK